MNTNSRRIHTLKSPSTRRVRVFTYIALATFAANFWGLNFQDNGVIKFLLLAVFLLCALALFNVLRKYRKSCLSVEFEEDQTKIRFISGEKCLPNEKLGYSISPKGHRIAISQTQMIGYKYLTILHRNEMENFSLFKKHLQESNLKPLTWIEPIGFGKFILNFINAFSGS